MQNVCNRCAQLKATLKGRKEAQLKTFVASASEFFCEIWLEKNHLDDFTRGRMIGNLEEVRSLTSVAEEFGINKSVISRAWKTFQTISTAVRKVGRDHTRKTTAVDDRYIVLHVKGPEITQQALLLNNTAATERQMSQFIVARHLPKGGLFAHHPEFCIALKVDHWWHHLEWCKEHKNWTFHLWSCVLFTDESRFSAISESQCQLIWREIGAPFCPSNITERDHYSCSRLVIWGEWKDSEKQSGFSGMGFVIQEVMVHTEPTPVGRGETHYNMAGASWNVRDLLEVFSRNLNHRWFCLAHLFTDQKFDGGILGLAYVGSPRRNSVGGICSPGHNWGSEHDPDLPECSPDGRHGGSFLMYTYSVSGYDPNNKKFSPCSIRSVRAVLLAKASKCFSKPEESFCGNSLVEEGEECDAGFIGSEDNDPCCDSTCKLKPGAICSDKNAPCCRSCQLVHGGIICRESQPSACKREAYCKYPFITA
ncbi:ADAM 17-like protease [Trichonephila clavipes]|nr:ADAM 17-like protease [Trichonephila clavipes]